MNVNYFLMGNRVRVLLDIEGNTVLGLSRKFFCKEETVRRVAMDLIELRLLVRDESDSNPNYRLTQDGKKLRDKIIELKSLEE